MKRIQLFEFEDFPWLPKPIRTGVTNLIVVFHKMMETGEVIAKLIRETKAKYNFSQIVDMGSGSGGAMPEVVKRLNAHRTEEPLNLIMTDLHPNPGIITRINEKEPDYISYRSAPLDATNFSEAPEGLKTMVNSFHHMPPDKARQILKSAQENREPLLIYEMGENFVPTLLWWLLLPLSLSILIVMVFFMTPFVRPLTWKQLLFTYLIPIIPIVYAWDGQASTVRMYTFKDIDYLLKGLKTENYSWEVAHAQRSNGKKLGYYILGLPTNSKTTERPGAKF